MANHSLMNQAMTPAARTAAMMRLTRVMRTASSALTDPAGTPGGLGSTGMAPGGMAPGGMAPGGMGPGGMAIGGTGAAGMGAAGIGPAPSTGCGSGS